MTANGNRDRKPAPGANDRDAAPEGGGLRSGAQLAFGAVLLVLGLLLVFERLDVVGPVDLWRLWPLFVIGFGVSRLLGGRDPETTRNGWFLIVFGLWFLVNAFEIFGLDWSTSWPLAIVAVGTSKLLAGAAGSERGQAIFLIVIGVLLQAVVLDLFGLDLSETWPLFIVAAGVWIMLSAFGRRPRRREENQDGLE